MNMKIERINTDCIKHPVEDGFFKHPTLPIWLSKTDDRILTPEGFVEPSVGGEYKYYIRRHIHVLKLETFLVKPTTEIKLWGNHIDGDKRNNDLDNLEWATSSMNLIHSFENGLRSDNLTGFLIDLIDGSIMTFNSLRECARHLDVNPGKLTLYLNSDRAYPLKFKFAIRLLGEPPTTLTASDVGKVGKASPKPLKAVNSETGETKYFAYGKSAREYFGLSTKTFRACLKCGCFGVWKFEAIMTYEEYVMCLEQDVNVLANKSKYGLGALRKEHVAVAKKVIVTDHLTGAVTEYENVYDFAKVNQFSVGEINRALKTKDSWRSFTFKFLE